VENKHLPENVLQPINYVSQTHTPIKHGSDKRTAGWVAASLDVLHFGSGGITVIKGKCVNQHIALMTVGGYDTKLCTSHAPSLTLWHRYSILIRGLALRGGIAAGRRDPYVTRSATFSVPARLPRKNDHNSQSARVNSMAIRSAN